MELSIEIAQKAFDWCVNHFGSPVKKLPKLIVKKDRRFTRMYGQYTNAEITIYLNTCKTEKLIVKTVIHEYTHFLQMPRKKDLPVYQRLLDTFEYNKHPFEVQARMYEEEFYKKCLSDIKNLD